MVAICSEQTISSKLTNTDTPLTPVHPAAAWLVALGITGIMTTPRTFGQQNNPAVTACGAKAGREARYERIWSQAFASLAAAHF